MIRSTARQRQHGAVLVVGLIVLALITLMVTAAFKFSTFNLKAVGNMQAHNEAVAAANMAIEQVIGSWSLEVPLSSDQVDIDIDNNGTFDYRVDIATPVCVKSTPGRTAGDPGSDCTTDLDGKTTCVPGTAAPSLYNVTWDIHATATGNNSGTTVHVRQGMSKSISQSQCNLLCPPAGGTVCV
jgi:hypothetical protein